MWFIMLLQGIALIFLAILLFFLLLICLILFVPIQYSILFDKQNDIVLDVKVSWLFRALSFAYAMKDKATNVSVKLFNRDLMAQKPKKKRKKSLGREKKEKEERESLKTEKLKRVPREIGSLLQKKAKEKKQTVKEKKGESFQDKMESIKNIFDSVYHYPDRNVLIMLTVEYLKKMFMALKPKVFSVKAEFGMNEPDQVGYILGIAQTIIPFSRLDIRIKGVFDKEVLNGTVCLKGNLYLYRFLFPTVQFLLAKPTWKVIKNLYS